MSQTQATRATVARFYESVSQGDLRTVFSLLHDKFTIEVPGYLPYGGVHSGADGLKTVFRGAATWVDPASAATESLTAEDDRAVGVANSRVAASGVPVTAVELWTVADSRLRSCRILFVDPRPILVALGTTSLPDSVR